MKQGAGWREAGENEDKWYLSSVSVFVSRPILTTIFEQHNELDATASSENLVLLVCANCYVYWHDYTEGEMQESLAGGTD